jgi:hypothetical protein
MGLPSASTPSDNSTGNGLDLQPEVVDDLEGRGDRPQVQRVRLQPDRTGVLVADFVRNG